MKSVESIKAKLKNEAVKSGRLYNEILTMFLLERFLYRVSISSYKENFILKGGVLLYMLYDKKYPRATADIDLLAQDTSNNTEHIKNIFHDILSIEYQDDFVTYSLESVNVSSITKGSTYSGVKVSVTSNLGNATQKLSIDIGFGDVVVPDYIKMELPVILDAANPILNVYSMESIIAEKLDTIIRLGELNSRLKDYYDIYKLLTTNEFDKRVLRTAIEEILRNRGTKFQTTIFNNEDYITSPTTKRMWMNMKSKRYINEELSFIECVSYINNYLGLIFDELGGK